jgi:hypothetical protein
MRRKPASKNKFRRFIKGLKQNLIYLSIAFVLVFLISNIFLSSILEYSFSLAKGGIGDDFNNANKFSLLVVNKDSMNNFREVDLMIFDKLGGRLYEFNLDVAQSNFIFRDNVYSLEEIYSKATLNQEDFVSAFEKNYGIAVNLAMILNPTDYEMYKKAISGNLMLQEIYGVSQIENIGVRNTFLMYSFSRNIPLENKKRLDIKNSVQLDRELSNIYLDSEVGLEKLSISISNSSEINGLGKKVSRFVTNSGGRVVDITTSETTQKSIIYYKDYSKSLEYLSKILNIKELQKYNDEILEKYPESVKSDLVIVLGLDIEELLR